MQKRNGIMATQLEERKGLGLHVEMSTFSGIFSEKRLADFLRNEDYDIWCVSLYDNNGYYFDVVLGEDEEYTPFIHRMLATVPGIVNWHVSVISHEVHV